MIVILIFFYCFLLFQVSRYDDVELLLNVIVRLNPFTVQV